MKKQFILFILSILFWAISGHTYGSVGLGVSPQKIDLVIFPGDSYESEFNIKNQSNIALPVSIRALPFSAQEKTGEMSFDKIDPDSPVFWIDFERTEFIFEANESKNIKFRIDIPSDINPGGYYIFIYFEPRMPSFYLKNMGPKVVPIIGVPVLISTTPLMLEPSDGNEFSVNEFFIAKEERVLFLENILSSILQIAQNQIALASQSEKTEFQIQIVKSQPSKFILNVKNNDIYHIRPSGTVLIENRFGYKIGQAQLLGQTILPGKSRNFDIVLENNLSDLKGFMSFGSYFAHLNILALSPVKGELFLSGKTPRIVFFSLASVLFFIISLLVIILLFVGRKRIKSSLRALFKF